MTNRKRVAKTNTKINTKSKRSKVIIANKCIFVFTWVCLPTSALGINFMPIKRNVPLIYGWAKIQERIQFMKGRWDFFYPFVSSLVPILPEWFSRMEQENAKSSNRKAIVKTTLRMIQVPGNSEYSLSLLNLNVEFSCSWNWCPNLSSDFSRD